jgi:LuxR family maltose regulon positive regulatory protein
VLVAAPAGFGKTTLLARWAAAGERRVAWLALDAGDAGLRTFLTHLAAAVATIEPELGADALALLESGAIDGVLVSLINDLDAVDGATVLALDD